MKISRLVFFKDKKNQHNGQTYHLLFMIKPASYEQNIHSMYFDANFYFN